MRVIWTYIFIFILIFLFFNSCEKENSTFPSISQLQVNQSGSYEFGDTIIVKVNIKDLDGPVRIDILQGASHRPLPSELFTIRGNDYTYRIFISDKYYESGTYSIRVQAFNGENGVSDFQTIRIEGLKKAIRGICYLAESGNSSILYKRDSLGNQTQNIFLGQFHKKIICDSKDAQILLLPSAAGSLHGLKFNSLIPEFNLNVNPSNLEFENLYHVDGDSYMILKDGRVFSINSSGQSFLEFSLPDNFLAKKMAFSNDQILVSAQKQGTNLNELFLLRKSNNTIVQRTFITGNPTDIAASGNGIYFLIYQKNNKTTIVEYNSSTGLITEKYNIDNEIPEALEFADGIFYISTDQNIYTFAADVFQFPQMLFSFGAEDLLYDEVNDEIYIVSGLNIWKSPLGSSQNQFVASGADPFLSLDIVYNK